MNYAIDTHCHLSLTPEADRNAVIERARKAGVQKMITVACTTQEVSQCMPLADEHDFIWTTAGIHPTELGTDIERDLEQVYGYAKNENKIVAIGEIGLDYYHDTFPRELQVAYFIGQLNIAKQVKKPAIIHSRAGKFAGENSGIFPDMVKALKEADFSNGVMHCFSGTMDEAKTYLEMGLMLSFTGIVTYDRNQELRDIIKMMPADRIMIETDSPFLPPKNHKGEQNEPAFVTEVANTIAEVRGISYEEALDMTSKNAERFFGIAD